MSQMLSQWYHSGECSIRMVNKVRIYGHSNLTPRIIIPSLPTAFPAEHTTNQQQGNRQETLLVANPFLKLYRLDTYVGRVLAGVLENGLPRLVNPAS